MIWLIDASAMLLVIAYFFGACGEAVGRFDVAGDVVSGRSDLRTGDPTSV